MARKVRTELIDDFDGTVIADGKGETITFALDHVEYEIDLSDKNAKKLRDSLGLYVAAARRTSAPTRGRGRPKGSGTSVRRDPSQTRAIKDWGAANGFDIPARGRLSQALLDAYEAAHKQPADA